MCILDGFGWIEAWSYHGSLFSSNRILDLSGILQLYGAMLSEIYQQEIFFLLFA